MSTATAATQRSREIREVRWTQGRFLEDLGVRLAKDKWGSETLVFDSEELRLRLAKAGFGKQKLVGYLTGVSSFTVLTGLKIAAAALDTEAVIFSLKAEVNEWA